MNPGLLIKDIMYYSDLNQTQLAEMIGCTQVTISRIRRNLCYPELKTLKKLVTLGRKYKMDISLEDFTE